MLVSSLTDHELAMSALQSAILMVDTTKESLEVSNNLIGIDQLQNELSAVDVRTE
jgi:hypothetical protein